MQDPGRSEITDNCTRRGIHWFDDFWQDVCFGLRMLQKTPGFAAAAIFSLSLGIGATTTVFSVVYPVYFPSYPFSEPDRLIVLSEAVRGSANAVQPSLVSYAEWREKDGPFAELAAYVNVSQVWMGQPDPERVQGIMASSNIFRMAGVQPLIGRDFEPDENKPGKGITVILGYSFWQRRYGGDSGIIGTIVTIANNPYTVIGVMPPDQGFPNAEVNYWISWDLDEDANRWNPFWHNLSVVGRLKKGVSLNLARAVMGNVVDHQEVQRSFSNSETGAQLKLFAHESSPWRQTTVLTLFGAVLFVLLITCVNVANLTLARALARRWEISIRAALGATRVRLLRYLLTESLLLSFGGAILGVIMADWGTRMFLVWKPPGLPGPTNATLNPAMLAFALGVAVITIPLFGLLPALQASRPDLIVMLKSGTENAQRVGKRVRGALVTIELALALILLTSAGLMMNSYIRLQKVELGFDPHNVIVFRVTVPYLEKRTQLATERIGFVDELLNKLQKLPWVSVAAATSVFPLDQRTTVTLINTDENPGNQNNWREVEVVKASESFFRATRISVIKGRTFSDSDGPDAPPAAIVSQRLANTLWPNQSAIGKTVRFLRDSNYYRIVGIVGDARYNDMAGEYSPKIYTPITQYRGGFPEITFVVRTVGATPNLVENLKAAVRDVDSTLPIDSIKAMEDLFEPWLARPRFYLALFGFFAVTAVLLSSVGVYSLMNYCVRQQAKEIGIRMAIGANTVDILVLVLKFGMRVLVIGVGLGSIGAFILTRFIKSFLFGVTPVDVVTFGVVCSLLIMVTVIACFIPARSATRVDPIDVLRCE